jgi:hypothetical protein
MPKVTIGLSTGEVGRISLEVDAVRGTGGPDFPKLVLPLDLRLTGLRQTKPDGTELLPITLLYLSGEFYSPEQRVVTKFRKDLATYSDGSYTLENQVQVEVPLDLLSLERIEQERKGDLRAALQIEGLVAVHASKGGIVRFEQTMISSALNFVVPKSHWVEKVLPQLGYGALELIEVKITSNGLPSGIPKAVEEIRQARTYLHNGDWEKAVGHCRNTMEAILNSRPLQIPSTSKFAIKVDEFIRDHLSVNLGGKQSKLLADEMKLLWEVCSHAVHPTPADYFKREDANFIVRNTTAILEYVSKVLP